MSKYLSIDLESTGLSDDAYIIEFAAVPVNTKKERKRFSRIMENNSFHRYIKCPSFEELEPSLNDFVKSNNKELIEHSHKNGISLEQFKRELKCYLESDDVINFFEGKKPVILGKSLSALDIFLLNRDLGRDSFMKDNFSHKTLDVTCFAKGLVDMGLLPEGCDSSSALAKLLLKREDVEHTAYEDAVDIASIYLKLLEIK